MHDKLPDMSEVEDWRDIYSETKVVENERSDGLDYRSLQKARNDTFLFLLNAREFEPEFEEIMPETDDEVEIIEDVTNQTTEIDSGTAADTMDQPEDHIGYFFGPENTGTQS